MYTWTGPQPHWLQLVSSLVSFPPPDRTTSFKTVQEVTALASRNYFLFSTVPEVCTELGKLALSLLLPQLGIRLELAALTEGIESDLTFQLDLEKRTSG